MHSPSGVPHAILDDGHIPPTRNGTERAPRGPVVGRKTHDGSRSDLGTGAAALMDSLLETAALAGADPRKQLRQAVAGAVAGRRVPGRGEVFRRTRERTRGSSKRGCSAARVRRESERVDQRASGTVFWASSLNSALSGTAKV